MSERDVLDAVDRIIDDFGHHRRDAYFAGFAEDACRAAWEGWEVEGFQVLGCRSTARRVQLLGDDAAVFTHDVATDLADGDGRTTVLERETIVMQRRGSDWVAVHEHLSPREQG